MVVLWCCWEEVYSYIDVVEGYGDVRSGITVCFLPHFSFFHISSSFSLPAPPTPGCCHQYHTTDHWGIH